MRGGDYIGDEQVKGLAEDKFGLIKKPQQSIIKAEVILKLKAKLISLKA